MAISAEILNSYKKIDEAKADALLMAEIEKNNKKIVVLDDDPTGVQTVHDISVYTGWIMTVSSADSMRRTIFSIS